MSPVPFPEPAQQEPERDLVARAVRGDSDAFAALFHTHRAAVYRVARSVLAEHEASLDALQDTFLKVHRGLGRWNGESSLRTWVVRIAVRTAIDHRRSAARSRLSPEAAQEPSHDPRPALEQALLLDRLRQMATRVKGKQGLVLQLRLLGGLSNREIAAALDLREPNVRMQLTKALRRLREML